jgi:prepilin-type N-terminal cleavage/methylation domain-containing protein
MVGTKQTLMLRSKAAKGFTLLELLVVSILMVIVVLITAQFWMWFSPSLDEMVGRLHLLREGRIITQNFAADFGSTVGATPVGEDRIVLCKDGGPNPDGIASFAAPDVLVDYYLSGSKLLRNDISTGADFAVADNVSAFTVEEISPTVIRISLDLQCSTASRQMIFYWDKPTP